MTYKRNLAKALLLCAALLCMLPGCVSAGSELAAALAYADEWRHIVIIRDLVTDETGQTVDYLVNSNTNNMRSYPASLYGCSRFLLIRVSGWND